MVPLKLRPKVYTLLLIEILVGVALLSVAFPPVTDSIKSLACNAPLPPVALNTASENVTAAVLLSDASSIPVITGSTLSYNVLELLFCEVLASFPAES